MKLHHFLGLSAFFASSFSASAATVILSDSTGGLIPDGSLGGLASTLIFDRPGEVIDSITVDLGIAPMSSGNGFHGDLYVYLTDGVSLVVLLNRPGRTDLVPDGYDDGAGISIRVSDSAEVDTHSYRVANGGAETTAIVGELNGSFQPDGRAVSPLAVTDGSLRTTNLADLASTDQGKREFTLFAADVVTGSSHELTGWSLNIETTVIPEPSSALLVVVGVGISCRRRRSGIRASC